MSDSITCLNRLFNIPKDTTGEFIVHQVRDRLSSGHPIWEGEIWMMVRDWLIGLSYEFALETDAFGAPRDGKIRKHIARSRHLAKASNQIAHAMSGAQTIIWENGPLASRGLGDLPLHFILATIDALGLDATPEAIICVADDFAVVGKVAGEIIENGGR